MRVKNAILDGAIVAVNNDQRPLFADLMRRTDVATYAAFDMLWLNHDVGVERPSPQKSQSSRSCFLVRTLLMHTAHLYWGSVTTRVSLGRASAAVIPLTRGLLRMMHLGGVVYPRYLRHLQCGRCGQQYDAVAGSLRLMDPCPSSYLGRGLLTVAQSSAPSPRWCYTVDRESPSVPVVLVLPRMGRALFMSGRQSARLADPLAIAKQ